MKMKRIRPALVLLAVLLAASLLTGCFKVTMDVKSNGSCDMTYEFDMSQLEGMMDADTLKQQIEDSIEQSNDEAGKEIVKLKSWKENDKDETITAVLAISNLNKMEDGTFFGSVKDLKDEDEAALDSMMDAKSEKTVKASKISDKLQAVYWPSSGTDEYGVVEITVKVPGTIKYISDGAELENSKTAVFSGQVPLVVYSKGGLPIIPIVVVVVVLVGAVAILGRKKKPTAPVPAGMNFDPKTGAPLNQAAAVKPAAPAPQVMPVQQPMGFDPQTGAPIQPAPAAPVQPAMNFDPQTGAPIQAAPATPAQPAMNFDPQTGAPISPSGNPPQA